MPTSCTSHHPATCSAPVATMLLVVQAAGIFGNDDEIGNSLPTTVMPTGLFISCDALIRCDAGGRNNAAVEYVGRSWRQGGLRRRWDSRSWPCLSSGPSGSESTASCQGYRRPIGSQRS
jgi:hypothetical protein